VPEIIFIERGKGEGGCGWLIGVVYILRTMAKMSSQSEATI